nr:capsid protein [Dicistroviridae sp.]
MGIIAEPMPGEIVLPAEATMQHADAREHSIISFLGRPQLLKVFPVSADQVRNTQLLPKPIIIPDTLLNAESGMYRNKLDGFTSFRATAVLKFQINSQPFQAGRIQMYSVPMPSLIAGRSEWLAKHISMTQALHNVQLDLAKQTEIELRIPFISPFNSYDLIHGNYPWAHLFVMVYSPVNQVGNDKLECMLWGHFEDVVLGAPTSGKISLPVAQGGNLGGLPPKKPSAMVVNVERSKESSGIISGLSKSASNMYDIVGEGIPALKGVTDVLSTLAKATGAGIGGIISGVGGLLGFSKPVLSHSGMTVVSRPSQFFGNVNGNDHSHVLSLDVLNAVDAYPGFGGTVFSETSLDYLKKIPQYITNFQYCANNKYNDKLAAWLVSPMNVIPMSSSIYLEGNVNGNRMDNSQPTVLSYISSTFEYWTGSLVYTVRFVKSDYHSGRVEISYHPFVYDNVDTKRMDFVYRLVVDLRKNSEVSFVVPFISPQPWKKTRITGYGKNAAGAYTDAPLILDGTFKPNARVYAPFTTGTVFVRALTPLIRANSIVSDNVECLVECRAGDDYQLQCPDKSPYFPISFYSALKELPKQQSGVVALPGTQETRTASIEGFLPPSITGDDRDIHREDTQQFCAGECFVDYLSLTRRAQYGEKVELGSDPMTVLYRTAMDYIRPPVPFKSKFTQEDKASGYQLEFSQTPTPLSFISSMFAFYRGGIRLKIYNPLELDLTVAQLFSRQNRNYAAAGVTQYNFIGPSAYEQTATKRFAEFQVPYYSPTLVTAFWPQVTSVGPGTQQFSQPAITTVLSCTKQSNSPSRGQFYIASSGADDFTLHTFIGVPPVIREEYFYNTTFDNKKGPGIVMNKSLQTRPGLYFQGSGTPDLAPTGSATPLLITDFKLADRSGTPCPPKKQTLEKAKIEPPEVETGLSSLLLPS